MKEVERAGWQLIEQAAQHRLFPFRLARLAIATIPLTALGNPLCFLASVSRQRATHIVL